MQNSLERALTLSRYRTLIEFTESKQSKLFIIKANSHMTILPSNLGHCQPNSKDKQASSPVRAEPSPVDPLDLKKTTF